MEIVKLNIELESLHIHSLQSFWVTSTGFSLSTLNPHDGLVMGELFSFIESESILFEM